VDTSKTSPHVHILGVIAHWLVAGYAVSDWVGRDIAAVIARRSGLELLVSPGLTVAILLWTLVVTIWAGFQLRAGAHGSKDAESGVQGGFTQQGADPSCEHALAVEDRCIRDSDG